jgi:hypothetical protein
MNALWLESSGLARNVQDLLWRYCSVGIIQSYETNCILYDIIDGRRSFRRRQPRSG